MMCDQDISKLYFNIDRVAFALPYSNIKSECCINELSNHTYILKWSTLENLMKFLTCYKMHHLNMMSLGSHGRDLKAITWASNDSQFIV